MGQFDKDPTVVRIKLRMKLLGIDLDKYLGTITNTWASTPPGFHFYCADGTAWNGLLAALVQSSSFGTDTMIGGSQHKGVSFRECGQSDSLHVVLVSPVHSKEKCGVHLDSVSVAESIDPKSGMINYDLGKVPQHLASDLWNLPLIMPSPEKGLVFGFRF